MFYINKVDRNIELFIFDIYIAILKINKVTSKFKNIQNLLYDFRYVVWTISNTDLDIFEEIILELLNCQVSPRCSSLAIALMPQHLLYEKVKSNVEELNARDNTICAIPPLDFELNDGFIKIQKTNQYILEFFEMLVVLQLLSMKIALKLENDVDMPRNLAKSVTVE